MARGVTKAERERRLALVETAIHRHGWSMTLEAALARQIGVTARAVRRYRKEVEDQTRKELDQDRRLIRASLMVRLRGHQRAAREAGKFGPLSSMLGLEARMTGVLEPEDPAVPDNLEALSKETLLEELAADLTASEIEELARLRDLLG